EADWNEAQEIISEEMRTEVLDIVGPSGTPDNGYALNLPAQATQPPFDFTVGPGTLYVGGVRVFLDQPVVYSNQKEWLDDTSDPAWVDFTQANTTPFQEFVYLLLREQEVSVVEDSALREVALGGPDTAQRMRVLQHIVRLNVRLSAQASDCAAALVMAKAQWAKEGLKFDAQTMRLTSQATLQADFSSVGGSSDPCEPAAQGGYLGADNQLIRVQISGFDAASNQYTFVWGYDNASFLYRVDVVDPQTLRLQSRPADAFHQPRAGQAVEVLR